MASWNGMSSQVFSPFCLMVETLVEGMANENHEGRCYKKRATALAVALLSCVMLQA